jgi:4-amino-4-deoxy-L-arabinose transferase-like glycosyltransferase
MLNKVAGGQESHGAPPGLYLAAVWATFWPWAPLAALAAPFAWASRRSPRIAFLLAWLVPSWLLFEAVPTKLPHYVLPLYPALALLVAIAIDEGRMARAAWARALPALSPIIAAVAAVATLVAAWHIEHRVAVPLGLALAATVVASVAAWRLQAQGRFVEAMPLAVAATLILAWGVYGLGPRTLPSLWPSPKLAAYARGLDCPNPAFLSAGFNEPSLVFLVGTDLELESGPRAAEFLAGGPCRMAFVEGRMAKGFADRAAALGLAPTPIGRVEGININGGKQLDIAVYRSADAVSP